MLIPLQWNSFWPALLAVTLAGTVVTAAPHAIIKRASSADTWSPPTSLVKPLPQVWDHEIATYSNALGFKNYGYDQVIATNGSLNFCVRWESNATVTSQDRADIEAAVKRSMKKWIDWLVGFDNFPFTEVKVQVVGWAVYAPSLLKGDTSGIQVYTDKDAAGVPQCSEECGRVFHQDSNYAACKAGAARHYGESALETWDVKKSNEVILRSKLVAYRRHVGRGGRRLGPADGQRIFHEQRKAG